MPGLTRTLVRLIGILAIGCALAGCGESGSDTASVPSDTTGGTATSKTPDSTAPDGSAEYSGHYSVGFEVSEFVPCSSDESWWLVGTPELMSQVQSDEPGRAPTTPVFVRVRGELSGPGSYGHLGTYDRQLTVTEVLEVGSEDGC